MPKNKEQKRDILADLKDKISRSKSIVFTTFDALGVKDNEELRKSLKKENGEYYVSKKTLMDIAFKDSNISDLDIKNLPGKVAVVFAYEDEVSPAKVVFNFKKDKEGKISFVGGVLDGNFISASEVENLAQLPSKQELYAKVVGSLNAPVSGFVNVLAGNIRGLVNVLKAVSEKK
ncbi:MAG: 50S ribosomal protein L10 [Patescibacteria group bacterium]|nr:50S ribosomal protein L10 [Patescibacteria group bacterium]